MKTSRHSFVLLLILGLVHFGKAFKSGIQDFLNVNESIFEESLRDVENFFLCFLEEFLYRRILIITKSCDLLPRFDHFSECGFPLHNLRILNDAGGSWDNGRELCKVCTPSRCINTLRIFEFRGNGEEINGLMFMV